MLKIAIFLVFNIKLIMHLTSLTTYLLLLNIFKQMSAAPSALASEVISFFLMFFFLEWFYKLFLRSTIEDLKEVIRTKGLKQ
jgi:hypothetical protein